MLIPFFCVPIGLRLAHHFPSRLLQNLTREIDQVTAQLSAGQGDLGGLEATLRNLTSTEPLYNNTVLSLQLEVRASARRRLRLSRAYFNS